jgi:Protein-L-isoaspartate carboxylmethyltransferase
MNVDHRFTQTQKQYAADDLETMSEARRYQAHVFELLRPHIGSSVLEVGCGIGTTSLQLAEIADRLVCIEPNMNCVSRARAALDGNPKIESEDLPSGRLRPRRAGPAAVRYGSSASTSWSTSRTTSARCASSASSSRRRAGGC